MSDITHRLKAVNALLMSGSIEGATPHSILIEAQEEIERLRSINKHVWTEVQLSYEHVIMQLLDRIKELEQVDKGTEVDHIPPIHSRSQHPPPEIV